MSRSSPKTDPVLVPLKDGAERLHVTIRTIERRPNYYPKIVKIGMKRFLVDNEISDFLNARLEERA